MSDDRTAPYERGFNHLGREYATQPEKMWADMRGECPVAHSDRFGSVWMPTTRDTIAEVAYNTELIQQLDNPAGTTDGT